MLCPTLMISKNTKYKNNYLFFLLPLTNNIQSKNNANNIGNCQESNMKFFFTCDSQNNAHMNIYRLDPNAINNDSNKIKCGKSISIIIYSDKIYNNQIMVDGNGKGGGCGCG